MKWKGLTKIGIFAGVEYGAPFFREWRIAKAEKEFVEREVDFIIAVALLNAEWLRKRLFDEILAAKLADAELKNMEIRELFKTAEEELASIKSSASADSDPDNAHNADTKTMVSELQKKIKARETEIARLKKQLIDVKKIRVKKSEIKYETKEEFARHIAQELAEKVVPPLYVRELREPLKYWVCPSPLFELKKDDLGLVGMIYDFLPLVAQEHYKLDGSYIRINDVEKLIEVEDQVAVKTIGVVTPTVSSFRAKVLSTPPEREVTYQQQSLLRDIPDFYIGAMFGTTIAELNPRGVPNGKPYISIPSLSIRFTETVLHNSLGYAILSLYPDRKNRAQFKTEFFLLNDALKLECAFAKDQLGKLNDETQRKVVSAIIDKFSAGTKITIGKIEDAAGISRSQVVATIKALKETPFAVELDEDKGEIKNSHTIIPKTCNDLTRYRKGHIKTRKILGLACYHAGDSGVDYDFIERDLPQIILEEEVDVVIIAGDLSEGNKYNQDRRKSTIDCFSTPKDHKELAGWLVADNVFSSFKARYEKTKDINASLVTCVVIPGNHDSEQRNPEPPLEDFYAMLTGRLEWLLEKYLKRMKVNYKNIWALVRQKMILLENPDTYENIGIIHEHMGGSQQSTYKGQNALKQFTTQSDARIVFLGNYHESNFTAVRIGNDTSIIFTLGTMKRVSPFENQRSKMPEFGVASGNIVTQDDNPIMASIKLIPSRLTFRLSDKKQFIEENKKRGRSYYDKMTAWKNRKA